MLVRVQDLKGAPYIDLVVEDSSKGGKCQHFDPPFASLVGEHEQDEICRTQGQLGVCHQGPKCEVVHELLLEQTNDMQKE